LIIRTHKAKVAEAAVCLRREIEQVFWVGAKWPQKTHDLCEQTKALERRVNAKKSGREVVKLRQTWSAFVFY